MSQRKYPNSRPRAVDLFCGAGGMSLGFEQAGFDIVLGVDADGHHVAAHGRNFPNGKVACMSIVDLNAKKVREILGNSEPIDLVFGGPPCQGFSSMGHRDQGDPRNTLVDEFARVVLDLRPRAFVMENVPAMLSGDTRSILDRVVADLEAGGYRITKPIHKLVASDFGVPQQRARLFVLGIRADVGECIAYPKAPKKGQPLRPTVFEAIADLPRIEEVERLLKDDCTAYDQPPVTRYAQVARGEIEDFSDLSVPRIWDRTTCSGCTRIRHAPASVELYAATPPGGFVPGHKLPRLDPHGLSPTLRAGSDSAHGSYTAPRPIHPYLPRCITAREAARLHGYPDWFRFFPTKWHAYKQIGNSVCPPVARAVGFQVAKALKVRYGAKSPKPLAVVEQFQLPEGRPRQQKRIPQLREYPPVVASMFNALFDPSKGTLKRTTFSFDDVERAIAVTSANLKWTRKETFVGELARSRNVKEILAEPLRHGYSIVSRDGKRWIGEFVPLGTPGAIDLKEDLGAKAGDMSATVQLTQSSQLLGELAKHLNVLLNDEEVRHRLWSPAVLRVEVESELLAFAESGGQKLRVIRANGRSGYSYALVGSHANAPNKSRVGRIGERQSVSEIISVTPITAKHILVSRFQNCREHPTESVRIVFALNGRH